MPTKPCAWGRPPLPNPICGPMPSLKPVGKPVRMPFTRATVFCRKNAGFARAVRNAGLIFVGPSPESIEVMGSKLAAKAAVASYNIPMVPGTPEAITDRDDARKTAARIGYPILIKASAGGGGKGMRIVENDAEFDEGMNRAVSEATSAFGDGSVFIEKYVTSPRHVEIQVLGDQHGNIIHLFERECSVQRRHQKVVEEAPSSGVDTGNSGRDGALCGRSGAGLWLLRSRNGGVYRRRPTEFLFSGNEHPASGRTPGGRNRLRASIW